MPFRTLQVKPQLWLVRPKFLRGQGAVPDGRPSVYSAAMPVSAAEWCAGLASARSARRLPAASPSDAASVITATREPYWLVYLMEGEYCGYEAQDSKLAGV